MLLDLPGHGHSTWLPVGAEYTLSSAISILLQIADALGWERFTLLGHSLGGGVASLLAAAAPERVEALIAIEALGALAEPVQSTATRLRDAVASARTLAERSLRLFPSMEMPVRARMMANQLTDPAARLLVERGVRVVDGGYSWCSDPRLTLPAAIRMTDAQIDVMLASIACPTQAIFATPAQPYFSGCVTRPPRGDDARCAPAPAARYASCAHGNACGRGGGDQWVFGGNSDLG